MHSYRQASSAGGQRHYSNTGVADNLPHLFDLAATNSVVQDIECDSESLQADSVRLTLRACTAGEQGHDEHAAAGGALHHVGHAQPEVGEGAHLQARLWEGASVMIYGMWMLCRVS